MVSKKLSVWRNGLARRSGLARRLRRACRPPHGARSSSAVGSSCRRVAPTTCPRAHRARRKLPRLRCALLCAPRAAGLSCCGSLDARRPPCSAAHFLLGAQAMMRKAARTAAGAAVSLSLQRTLSEAAARTSSRDPVYASPPAAASPVDEPAAAERHAGAPSIVSDEGLQRRAASFWLERSGVGPQAARGMARGTLRGSTADGAPGQTRASPAQTPAPTLAGSAGAQIAPALRLAADAEWMARAGAEPLRELVAALAAHAHATVGAGAAACAAAGQEEGGGRARRHGGSASNAAGIGADSAGGAGGPSSGATGLAKAKLAIELMREELAHAQRTLRALQVRSRGAARRKHCPALTPTPMRRAASRRAVSAAPHPARIRRRRSERLRRARRRVSAHSRRSCARSARTPARRAPSSARRCGEWARSGRLARRRASARR